MGAPAQITANRTAFRGSTGATATVTYTAIDAGGAVVANVLLTPSIDAATRASVTPASARTDNAGQATFTLTLGPQNGSAGLRVAASWEAPDVETTSAGIWVQLTGEDEEPPAVPTNGITVGWPAGAVTDLPADNNPLIALFSERLLTAVECEQLLTGTPNPRYQDETIAYVFDYGKGDAQLEPGESLIGASVTRQLTVVGSTKIDPNPDLQYASTLQVIDGRYVAQYLSGGVKGGRYMLRIVAPTTLGRTLVRELKYRVAANVGLRARQL